MPQPAEFDCAVVLLRRRYNGLTSGVLELPTAVVGGGETLPDAVARAVREKVGLVVTDVGEYVGTFDCLSHGGVSRQINFAASAVSMEPVRLCEHYGYRWMPLNRICR